MVDPLTACTVHLEKPQTMPARESSQERGYTCKATGAELSKAVGAHLLHQCDLDRRHGVKGDHLGILRFACQSRENKQEGVRLLEPSEAVPKSKELVSSSSSGNDSDSEVDKKLKRKKQVAPEKPVKKQKTGETSRALSSSKQSSSSRDDNMFQIGKMRYFFKSRTMEPAEGTDF
uniref:Uncharacterized protein n=1 Tax=Macaca fascicularis TaxID=9541 RepID=A0A7N9CFY7_MACFA